MTDTPTYEQYSRAELIDLLKLKNKKIDSQRSMLYQSRVKRERMQTKLIAGYKVVKENSRLKSAIKKLNLRNERLVASGRNKPFTVKECAPVIMNTIIAYSKLKNQNYITDEEIFILILAYKKEWFFTSDIEIYYHKCGRNHSSWKSDLRLCCEAGFFNSNKIGYKKYYFMSSAGRQRLESILNYLNEIKYT